ncbi:hypothetical protein DL767_007793 [Monosporascus sp. MG133]|nr:hypothetical protein DL767_007793 [Monosporascus sp. MG133]
MSFNPQTPQSPSQFSPSNVDHSSSMNSSMTSITTTLPTPAHSVNGHFAADGSHDYSMTDDLPTKRKRPFDDMGDQEQKKVHLEDPRKLAHFASSPCLSEDLFEKFNLAGIAAEVARTKPNGEKNALRKTYKGHIKSLGVNGHFDVDKKDPCDPDGFLAMCAVPESEWYVHEVQGKNIELGFSDRVKSDLLKATTMAKGPISKDLWDNSVLGDLALSNVPKKAVQDQGIKATAPSTPAGSTAGVTTKSGKLQAPQADRMRRNIKKRSYQDSSFEGYGDGFSDNGETGYSTGEGDDRSSKLKRRKQNPGNGSSYNGGNHLASSAKTRYGFDEGLWAPGPYAALT